MAVSYRSGSKGQSSTAATSASVTQPTGAAAGDHVIVSLNVKDSQKFNLKTGWELEERHNGATIPFTTGVYRRTLDGTESWPISFGWTGTSVKFAWNAAAFQPGTPGNVVTLDGKATVKVDTTSATTHTANSVTAVASNVTSVIVNCGRRSAGSATGITVSPPTNWTEDATNGDVTTASGTSTTLAQLGVETAYRTGQSGTVTPGAATWSLTATANVYHYLLTEITPGTFTRIVMPPDEVSQSGGVANSVTAFTPPDNSLVRIGFSWLDATDQLGKAFTVKDSNNVSYTQKQMGGDADGGCYNGFYDHYYTTSPGAITITITCSGTGNTAQADALIQPYVYLGADTDQSTAAQNQFSEAGTSTNTYLVSLTPTRLGSDITVAGAPNHNSGSTGPVDANSETTTDVDWDNGNVGSRGTFGHAAVPTNALSSITVGWTSVGASPFGYGIMATEVLPAQPAVSQPLTDSGSASDPLAVASSVPLAETGAGADALAVASSVPMSDSGTGTATLGVMPGLTEAGSASDTLGITAVVAVALTDAGSAAESLAAPPGLLDSGAGSDTLTVTTVTLIALTDSGTGVDTLNPPVGLSESGSATETFAVSQPTPLTDAGTGSSNLGIMPGLLDSGSATETLALVQPTGLSDAGTGAETLGVMPGLLDSGTASDTLTVSAVQPIALSDSGTGADTLATLVVTLINLNDAGTATETLAFNSAVPLSDAGTSTATLGIMPGLAEAGSGADTLALTQPTGMPEAGSAAETLGILSGLTDNGTGSDTLTVLLVQPIALSESSAGSDALTVASVTPVALSDSGTGSDVLNIPVVGIVLTEPGAGSETLKSTTAVTLAELSAGTDALAISGTAMIAFTEPGSGTDTLAVALSKALAETGSASDTLTVKLLEFNLNGLACGVPHSNWAAGDPHDDGVQAKTPQGHWAVGSPRDGGVQTANPHGQWQVGTPHD